MRRKALYSALSAQLSDGAVRVLDAIELDEIKTQRVAKMLADLHARGNRLLLLSDAEGTDEVIYKSCRNIPQLIARPVPHFSVQEVLWADSILITKAALAQMEPGGEADAQS
jgi:large subunit ribosomal protein L4